MSDRTALEESVEILSETMDACFTTNSNVSQNGEPANVVDGLFAIADGLRSIAGAIQRLGLADASTPFGAVEALSVQIDESSKLLAGAISELGNQD